MGKFEKDYHNNQNQEWKEKYINYISLKQKIKQYLTDMEKEGINELTPIEKMEIFSKYKKEFTDELDKEIRRVFIFFSKKEKHLYIDINKYLHIKEDFSIYTLEDYLTQYSELKELSMNSYQMSKYVFYNLKCLLKILDKFDKKILGSKNKDEYIKNNYIISKLEDQNSDILYLINFKMLDEVNAIVEDLIKCLKDSFKSNKNKFTDSVVKLSDNDSANGENLLEKKTLNLNDTSAIIDSFHKIIQENLEKIDKISNNIIILFMPWKEFLRISGDVSSKLIQLSKELNNMNNSMGLNDTMGSRINNRSIVDTISFSKQNSHNIYITLAHGFIYMFSFSCSLPTYPELITINKGDIWNETNDAREYLSAFFGGLLMIMIPLGNILSYIYETTWFESSTKIQLLLSFVGLFLGNLFYFISVSVQPFILLFIGRFLIGDFNLRAHNKMYIMNFLLKKDVSYYLTMFHTFSMLGLSTGFLLNIATIHLFDNNKLINKYTFGSLLSALSCLILFFISLKFFTEARSSSFNMTSMHSFSSTDALPKGSLISHEPDSEHTQSSPQVNTINEVDMNNGNVINDDLANEKFTKDVKKKSLMVNDIDAQLGHFNRQSNFNDTNLVSLSISQLTYREKEGLQYLFKSFIVYLLFVFTTKFTNEAIFINLPIFIYNKKKINPEKNLEYYVPTILGISILLVLIIELALKHKNKCITEKTLLIILLVLNSINNILIIFLIDKDFIFYLMNGLSLIISNIIEKYSTHFFEYIIPHNYIICKIQGNTFINIIATLSRIIAAALIISFFNYYALMIYILIALFSLVCTVLYFVFYSDIRIKSISRIITKQDKDQIKIATGI